MATSMALTNPIAATIESIDEVVHQKVRLSILSALVAADDADFRTLKLALGVTDGNLSIHLKKLEDAGYVEVRKEFVEKKPRTTYTITDAGRAAFVAYLTALEQIVEAAKKG